MFMCGLTLCCCSVTKLYLTLYTHQAPLASTIPRNLFKFMFIELVILYNHFILC